MINLATETGNCCLVTEIWFSPQMSNSRTLREIRSILFISVVWAMLGASVLAQSQPFQYFYDDLGRLVTVVSSDGTVVSYVYDAVGNILYVNRSTTINKGTLALYAFSPEEGPISTPVTIYGAGFSPNPASDIVKFNGVFATVTSATTSTLATSVPAGATTGPISVTVGNDTVTSTTNFTVLSSGPTILSVWPKSTLFNTVISHLQVTGTGLLGSTFFFNSGQLVITNVSISGQGTSATMTVTAGTTAGTFALVGMNSYGNSGEIPTQPNRFTLVYPYSPADTDGDGTLDVVEAAYGTDPIDPHSYPNGNSVPLFGGVNSLPFSVLNALSPPGASEADGVPFSVLNTSSPGTQAEAVGANSVRKSAPKPDADQR